MADKKCKGCIYKKFRMCDNSDYGFCTNVEVNKKLNIPHGHSVSCFYARSSMIGCNFKEVKEEAANEKESNEKMDT